MICLLIFMFAILTNTCNFAELYASTAVLSRRKFRPVRLGYWNLCTYRHKRTNERALTFTVGAALALETASSAAG